MDEEMRQRQMLVPIGKDLFGNEKAVLVNPEFNLNLTLHYHRDVERNKDIVVAVYKWRGIRGKITCEVSCGYHSDVQDAIKRMIFSHYGTKQQMNIETQDVVRQILASAIGRLGELESKLLDQGDNELTDDDIEEIKNEVLDVMDSLEQIARWK